jgi:hypothetical protein
MTVGASRMRVMLDAEQRPASAEAPPAQAERPSREAPTEAPHAAAPTIPAVATPTFVAATVVDQAGGG